MYWISISNNIRIWISMNIKFISTFVYGYLCSSPLPPNTHGICQLLLLLVCAASRQSKTSQPRPYGMSSGNLTLMNIADIYKYT